MNKLKHLNIMKKILEDRIDEHIDAAVRKNVDDSDPHDYRNLVLNEFIRDHLDTIMDNDVVYDTLKYEIIKLIRNRFDIVQDNTLYNIEDERDYKRTLENLPY